jgi:hypothetical protein
VSAAVTRDASGAIGGGGLPVIVWTHLLALRGRQLGSCRLEQRRLPDHAEPLIEAVWLGQSEDDGVLLTCGGEGRSIGIDTRQPAASDLGQLGAVEVVEATSLTAHGPLARIAMLEASPTRHPVGVVLGFADGATACIFKDGDQLRLTVGRAADVGSPLEITLF